MPETIAARDSLAPCIKNSNAIAAVVRCSNPTLTSPSQGKIEAIITTSISTNKNLSIRKRCNQDMQKNSFNIPLALDAAGMLATHAHWQRFFLLIRGNAQLNQLHHRNRFRCWHWIGCRTQNGFTDPSIVSRIITR
ncbi:Uncharacterised protein [Yersinia enterocolitica]|nr:Uncharacterised protein [Yersinia enterocolitica]